jgi:hypothetical protein
VTTKSIRIFAIAALVAAALPLSACGSSDDDTSTASAPDTAATTPADNNATTPDDNNVTTPDDKNAADTADNGCGHRDVVDAVKKAVTSDKVTQILIIGGCQMVSIRTSLDPDAMADGIKICKEASEVAYTGDIFSVSVDGSDGHELATSLKDQPCI